MLCWSLPYTSHCQHMLCVRQLSTVDFPCELGIIMSRYDFLEVIGVMNDSDHYLNLHFDIITLLAKLYWVKYWSDVTSYRVYVHANDYM